MVSGQPHRVVGAGITTLVISDLRCPAGPVPWLRGQGGQDPEETHDQPSYLVASDFTRQQRWCLCPTVGTSQIPGPGRAATHQPLPQKRFPAPLVIHAVPACPSFPRPSMAAAPTTKQSHRGPALSLFNTVLSPSCRSLRLPISSLTQQGTGPSATSTHH